jgi:proteic killer suppression protein
VEEKGASAFPAPVVEAFFEVLAIIDSAADERDLRAMKGLRLEKLRGNRAGQSSMRLNKQFRLIVSLDHDEGGAVVVILAIEDYH